MEGAFYALLAFAALFGALPGALALGAYLKGRRKERTP